MGLRHIEAVKALEWELVGLQDINHQALQKAKSEHHLHDSQLFFDVAGLMNTVHPECVIVSTTGPSHCDYTCAAAVAGARYVLCEKPMAISLAQCDHMIETCRRNSTRLAVNHQRRFMQAYVKAKEIVNSDSFGSLSSVTVISGNFGLAMNGIHFFELFSYLTGERPQFVTSWFSDEIVPNPRGLEFIDRGGSIRIDTPRGKRFYLEAGPDQGHGVLCVLSGRYGRVIYDDLAGTMFLDLRQDEYRDLPTTRYGMPNSTSELRFSREDPVTATVAVLKALIAESNYPTGEDGRDAVAILVAAHVSNENGHVAISLDEHLPRARSFSWA